MSIILPVYNEVEHLEQEVDRVRAAMDASEYSYEIIIVDDGSSDGSGELALTLPDVRVIRFLQNRGSGSARKAGTAAARGRVTVWTDVDMTYPNDTIPQLVKELDGYDQVVGARTTEEGTMKSLRVPAKWFIRKLASFLTKTKIPDLNSGFRAFRTDVARQYLRHLPPGFSCVTTMTMTFLSGGYSVKYIPIEYGKRAGQVEVPPDQGHAPLRHAGRAHGALVQPAAPLPADRVRAAGARHRQADLRPQRRTTSASPPTRC